MQLRRAPVRGASALLKLLWTLLILIPFAAMILLAFRSLAAIYDDPLGLSGAWVPENFQQAWKGPAGGVGFRRYAQNSLLVAGVALRRVGRVRRLRRRTSRRRCRRSGDAGRWRRR